jgi:hypothetical protein
MRDIKASIAGKPAGGEDVEFWMKMGIYKINRTANSRINTRLQLAKHVIGRSEFIGTLVSVSNTERKVTMLVIGYGYRKKEWKNQKKKMQSVTGVENE